MDRFKQYMQENKDRLDIEAPGEYAWDAIRPRLAARERTIYLPIFKKAVAAWIILLLGAGVYYIIINSKNPETKEGVSAVHLASKRMKWRTIPMSSQPDSGNKIAVITDNPANDKAPLKTSRKDTHKSNALLNENILNKAIAGFAITIENQKTLISSTPVSGVSADYFNESIGQYRSLEAEEKKINRRIARTGLTATALDELLLNLRKRILLLQSLKEEMDKVNESNRDKQAGKTYINII